MGWLITNTEINHRSSRWNTAVHEAAHWYVARQLGVSPVRASIGGGWFSLRDGYTDFEAPTRKGAVISLAGPYAAKLITGRAPGSGGDYADARVRCKDAGITYRKAEAEARRLVQRHRDEIVTWAERLYRDGSI